MGYMNWLFSTSSRRRRRVYYPKLNDTAQRNDDKLSVMKCIFSTCQLCTRSFVAQCHRSKHCKVFGTVYSDASADADEVTSCCHQSGPCKKQLPITG